MKNILVPTDLSKCATHAMELGFAFAEFYEAKLYFYTCIDIPENWDELTEEQRGELPEKQQLVKNANVMFDSWKSRAKREGIKLEIVISGGKFIDELQRKVVAKKINFVVMGSHGISGKNEYFIGSNTQKAVRKLHIPVFVIKKPLKEYAFKNVVFASNFDANEKPSFLKFLNFIKWFTPETIHLLAINVSDWFKQPSFLMRESMNDFKALCSDFNCKTHFYRDFSVDAGIRHFAEDIDADLIVISNHIRHPLKRIFSGSRVEALINHCDLPILSIDFEEEPIAIHS